MRVISQDGKIDVPYENFVFSILNSSGGNYGIVAVKMSQNRRKCL